MLLLVVVVVDDDDDDDTMMTVLIITVDGRNPAPPQRPWKDDCPVNTNKQWFPIVLKWCKISSIHSMMTLHAEETYYVFVDWC